MASEQSKLDSDYDEICKLVKEFRQRDEMHRRKASVGRSTIRERKIVETANIEVQMVEKAANIEKSRENIDNCSGCFPGSSQPGPVVFSGEKGDPKIDTWLMSSLSLYKQCPPMTVSDNNPNLKWQYIEEDIPGTLEALEPFSDSESATEATNKSIFVSGKDKRRVSECVHPHGCMPLPSILGFGRFKQQQVQQVQDTAEKGKTKEDGPIPEVNISQKQLRIISSQSSWQSSFLREVIDSHDRSSQWESDNYSGFNARLRRDYETDSGAEEYTDDINSKEYTNSFKHGSADRAVKDFGGLERFNSIKPARNISKSQQTAAPDAENEVEFDLDEEITALTESLNAEDRAWLIKQIKSRIAAKTSCEIRFEDLPGCPGQMVDFSRKLVSEGGLPTAGEGIGRGLKTREKGRKGWQPQQLGSLYESE